MRSIAIEKEKIVGKTFFLFEIHSCELGERKTLRSVHQRSKLTLRRNGDCIVESMDPTVFVNCFGLF